MFLIAMIVIESETRTNYTNKIKYKGQFRQEEKKNFKNQLRKRVKHGFKLQSTIAIVAAILWILKSTTASQLSSECPRLPQNKGSHCNHTRDHNLKSY